MRILSDPIVRFRFDTRNTTPAESGGSMSACREVVVGCLKTLIKIKNPADNYQCAVFERKATFGKKKRFSPLQINEYEPIATQLNNLKNTGNESGKTYPRHHDNGSDNRFSRRKYP
ncbi:MAG: hypothetical protein IAE84_15940 [Saprospiraceae bacterium]|nr:hypothetical protein [Saprospiraceae bacterium]HRD81921.1 hypothetical protein [Saprospiraceae bacterium]